MVYLDFSMAKLHNYNTILITVMTLFFDYFHLFLDLSATIDQFSFFSNLEIIFAFLLWLFSLVK